MDKQQQAIGVAMLGGLVYGCIRYFLFSTEPWIPIRGQSFTWRPNFKGFTALFAGIAGAMVWVRLPVVILGTILITLGSLYWESRQLRNAGRSVRSFRSKLIMAVYLSGVAWIGGLLTVPALKTYGAGAPLIAVGVLGVGLAADYLKTLWYQFIDRFFC